MKKKILIGTLLLSLMTSVFAVESGVKTETNMTSIGFGIHALSLYTDKIGLYVNLDLVFPQSINLKVKSKI